MHVAFSLTLSKPSVGDFSCEEILTLSSLERAYRQPLEDRTEVAVFRSLVQRLTLPCTKLLWFPHPTAESFVSLLLIGKSLQRLL